MTERGILFSAPMVRALLADKKTQTRRVVKPLSKRHPLINLAEQGIDRGVVAYSGHANDPLSWGYAGAEDGADMPIGAWVDLCPYGVPGDRLWVRETWAAHWMYDDVPPTMARSSREDLRDSDNRWFRGDGDDAPSQRAVEPSGLRGKWRPSIFMPRWASRITLEVTDVRVERLHEISEADCWAEGIEELDGTLDDNSIFAMARRIPGFTFEDAKPTYACLWELINGAGSWDDNPWVWALAFRRVS